MQYIVLSPAQSYKNIENPYFLRNYELLRKNGRLDEIKNNPVVPKFRTKSSTGIQKFIFCFGVFMNAISCYTFFSHFVINSWFRV